VKFDKYIVKTAVVHSPSIECNTVLVYSRQMVTRSRKSCISLTVWFQIILTLYWWHQVL